MCLHLPIFPSFLLSPPPARRLIRLITAFLGKKESSWEVGYTQQPTLGILIFVLILSDRQVHNWLLLLTLESGK